MKTFTRSYYECEICNTTYSNQESAEYCESKIVPNNIFDIGDRVIFFNSYYMQKGITGTVTEKIISNSLFSSYLGYTVCDFSLDEMKKRERSDTLFSPAKDIHHWKYFVQFDSAPYFDSYAADYLDPKNESRWLSDKYLTKENTI